MKNMRTGFFKRDCPILNSRNERGSGVKYGGYVGLSKPVVYPTTRLVCQVKYRLAFLGVAW